MAKDLVPPEMTNNLDMMETISRGCQSYEDVKSLTSNKITDQLKVFLIAQARNELYRVVKLTRFLDKLENNYVKKLETCAETDNLTLKQYGDALSLITELLTRSNEIISKVLKDDSLLTVFNATVYTPDSITNISSVASSLKDAQSRERVRSVIQNFLTATVNYTPKEVTNDE